MSNDWAQVYAATYEDLVRFLYRKVWDEERAQDLAQETFVRCMRTQRPLENVRAFVFTIAINLARDEARTVLRRRKHLTLLKNETTAQVEPTVDVEREQRIAAVEAALSDLSDRDRDILLLWDAGLSYQDIAAQTGLAIGAIGTTLNRARKRLVQTYEEIERQKHVAHR
ncbi:MAG TPA: sigma-70 family RNA polymerase sigma factor [Longimicrobiales bacterium]|nr:sigma-70 family RNA polymerase sigma factor [Longimicrobiales bacterium]